MCERKGGGRGGEGTERWGGEERLGEGQRTDGGRVSRLRLKSASSLGYSKNI